LCLSQAKPSQAKPSQATSLVSFTLYALRFTLWLSLVALLPFALLQLKL